MYQNRIKLESNQRVFYLITNRIVGGSFVLGETEKEYLRGLLFNGQERLAYTVWDYVIMDNHYHALIEIPDQNLMSNDELIGRWQKYHKLSEPINPGDRVLEGFRSKIHDISFVVSNFQQRFTQWYNKRNDRWGKLFGGRFDSVIVDQEGAIARMMAYITLNPVRANILTDPAEYRWSGYGERMANGKLTDNDKELAGFLIRELGLQEGALQGGDKVVLNRIWARFREFLLGHSVESRDVNVQTVRDLIKQDNKPINLEWPQRLMLKTRFATRGVAIGSRAFVADILHQQKKQLGYRRDRNPLETRAWDEIYCLRKHRIPIG